MKFTDAEGREQNGEVWSPGPLASTVWVLLPDGKPVAVRLGAAPCELMVTVNDPDRAARPSQEDRVPYTVDVGLQRLASRWRRLAARSAPRLSDAAWRKAVEA